MKNISKNTAMWIISAMSVATATTTVGVAATNNNYQRWSIIRI